MSDEPLIAELDGVALAYRDEGPRDGAPVLLVHGFASNMHVNWYLTSWVEMLTDAGRRVVAFDNRGHGGSQAFHDPADYGPDIFARDSVALLDRLGIGDADVVGYSMGARIGFAMAAWHGARVRRLALCGMGANLFGSGRDNEIVAQVLEADDPEAFGDPAAMTFRRFAERTGSDLRALAACIRPSAVKLTPDLTSLVTAPTIVAVGGDDDVAGPAEPLAGMLPRGEAFTVPGRDHMKSTGDPALKRAVLEFLER